MDRPRPRWRHRAATALAGLLLGATACGDPGDDAAAPAADGAGDGAGPVAAPEGAPREGRVLDVVALTAGGGATQSIPVPVAQPEDAAAYVERLEPPAREPLLRAIDEASVPPGLALRAAVVGVGCDEPADVLLEGGGAGPWRVQAVPSRSTVQCLLPLTFVALVAVPG